jgi:uncharacterized protein (DUF2147 family)
MSRIAISAVAMFVVLAALTTLARAAGGDPTALWLTEDNSAVVKIADCGPALCGTIVWSQKPADAKGRPLCGRQVLGDLLATGANAWGRGWVYAPRADAKYPATMVLGADGKLKLHIAAGLFGKDQIWTRPAQAVAACAS